MPFVDTTSLAVIERLPGRIEDDLEVTIDGAAIIVDHPARRDFGG